MNVQDILESIQQFIALYALKAVGATFTLIIGFWVINRITKLLDTTLEHRKVDVSLRPFLISIVGITLKVLLLLSVASMFGIEVTSFIAIFSAMAFAIGLALQGNLANFASGIVILIFKFYKVGDFIKTQGHAGTVKEIKIFHTVLQGVDNRLIILPNAGVTSEPIENFTATGTRRHDITIGISYGADIDRAKEVIASVIQRTPNVLLELDPAYEVFVNGLADSSVNLHARFTTKNDDFWPAHRYFMEHVKKELDQQGIGIPFPQMDIHLHQKSDQV